MFLQPERCTFPGCANQLNLVPGFCRKRGYFTCKRTGKKIARYQCKLCDTTFSNRSEAVDRYQKRPDINERLVKYLASGVTLRRAAKLLDVAYNTVCSRLPWLAEQARKAHDKALISGELTTTYIQFDEMKTFEHAAPKALSIALAVRAKTGQILGIRVGRIPANGKLAAIGQRKYNWVNNDSPAICAAVLRQAALAAAPSVTVACDGATAYPNIISAVMPHAFIDVVIRNPKGGLFDDLFRLNHVCAKIRADVARMARRTWSTTKNRFRLQDHLDIYIAWNNGYKLELRH